MSDPDFDAMDMEALMEYLGKHTDSVWLYFHPNDPPKFQSWATVSWFEWFDDEYDECGVCWVNEPGDGYTEAIRNACKSFVAKQGKGPFTELDRCRCTPIPAMSFVEGNNTLHIKSSLGTSYGRWVIDEQQVQP